GATGPSLTLTSVSFADNNAKFKVKITNAQGSIMSDEVTLTVQQDTVAPTISYARGSDTFRTVTIGFSEPVVISGATFSINKGLSITSTTQVSPTTVVLGTSAQTPGEVYTITVNGVKDLAFIPNTIAADSKVDFYAWVLAVGFLRHEYWGGINTAPGTIDDLLNDPRYPNAPDEVGYVSAFNTRTIFPNDSHEYYGAKMSGFIIPKETANYYFFLRSDDASQLYLSTDATPENLVLIAEETGCCNAFLEPGAPQTSAWAIPLVAGPRYFVMAVMKEGTGGDYCQVAWRKENDTTPASSLTPIPGEFLATYADPGIAVITITQQPRDVATSENKTATFSVVASGSPLPLIYQWQRANPGSSTFVNIPGATSASYTTPMLKRATDDGARYRVLVTVPGKTVASAEARLSVEVDITPPALVRVAAGVDFKSVHLIFSEPLNPASATNSGNYTIPGLTVTGARLVGERKVILATSQQAEDTTYTVTVGPGVTDTAIPANPIDPNANRGSFISPVLVREAMAWEIWTGLRTDTVTVSELTGDARYPLDPSLVKLTPGYEGPGFGDGYGARLRGWITPKVTDNYVFFLAADDNAELWLSTDDTEANKRMIAFEPNWANQREWVGDSGGRRPGLVGNPYENVSQPIRLEAGKRYYTEVLWKEGGGGDHAAVAWKRASAPDPENGSPPMWGDLLSTAVPRALLRSIALPLELASPLGSGHADKPGFVARVYQVDQDGSTVSANQTSRAEQELAGLLGPNVADLSGAVNGVFLIDTIINWNQDGVDIGSIPGDTPIPGIPGIGKNTARNTDNIAVEIITYAEFPKAGAYMMAVASDDGFKVTATDKAPVNIRAVRIHPPSSAAGSYYAVDGSTTYGGAFKPITAPLVGKVVLADPDHGCDALRNADKMKGAIALIYRGVCRFDAKVPNAVNAGAIAAIIVNNRDPGSADGPWPIVMGGSYPQASAVMISKPDGAKIRAALEAGEEVIADITPDDTPALGEFDGGRGIADTFFPVYVLQPGVYPLRLVWYEGEGGANVEWFMYDGAGNRVALNDRTNPTAIKTYRARTFVPPVTPDIKSIKLEGANVVIVYKGVLQQATRLSSGGGDWSDVPGATSTDYTTYTTSAGGTERYFRARQP
ncbi:MAG: PA14 domain-containing protein, partial [Verrucomicrobiae bacterium]|nr:PA14 domain-containing protein [Verrucomicrobiae bacterium]